VLERRATLVPGASEVSVVPRASSSPALLGHRESVESVEIVESLAFRVSEVSEDRRASSLLVLLDYKASVERRAILALRESEASEDRMASSSPAPPDHRAIGASVERRATEVSWVQQVSSVFRERTVSAARRARRASEAIEARQVLAVWSQEWCRGQTASSMRARWSLWTGAVGRQAVTRPSVQVDRKIGGSSRPPALPDFPSGCEAHTPRRRAIRPWTSSRWITAGSSPRRMILEPSLDQAGSLAQLARGARRACRARRE
jgi:hypothetical protein